MALLLQILLVSGGWTGSDRLDDFTEIFDPSLGSWRAGAELRRPRSRLRATNIDNRVLLFGINILLAFNMSYIILTHTLAGGYDGSYLNTILEYNITGDSYKEIGTMIQTRTYHAVSVVKYEDFSEWCQTPERIM